MAPRLPPVTPPTPTPGTRTPDMLGPAPPYRISGVQSDTALTPTPKAHIGHVSQASPTQGNPSTSRCGKPFKSPVRLQKHENKCRPCIIIISTENQQAERTRGVTLELREELSSESIGNCTVQVEDNELCVTAVCARSETALKEVGPMHDQSLPFQQTTDSSHSHDTLATPDRDTRGRRRTSPRTKKNSSAEQSPNTDRGEPDANGEDLSSPVNSTTLSPDDKSSNELTPKDVHRKLRDKLEENLTSSDGEGRVYLLSDPARPGLYKIGKSDNPTTRMSQIGNQCNIQVNQVHEVRTNYYGRTERLIQAYFADLCGPYPCDKCGRKHQEWFKIDKGPAIAALEKWNKFMIQQNPYDAKTRQLTPFIKHWIEKTELSFADDVEMEAVREHWDRMLTPTWVDRFLFYFGIAQDLVWNFYWHVNAMFAWTVTFLLTRHPITFILMGASVIGTFYCISDERYRSRSKRGSKKKTA